MKCCGKCTFGEKLCSEKVKCGNKRYINTLNIFHITSFCDAFKKQKKKKGIG